MNNWFYQLTTTIWDLASVQMNRKSHILEFKKITEARNPKRSSKLVRGYGVLHSMLRNFMSLSIKIVFQKLKKMVQCSQDIIKKKQFSSNLFYRTIQIHAAFDTFWCLLLIHFGALLFTKLSNKCQNVFCNIFNFSMVSKCENFCEWPPVDDPGFQLGLIHDIYSGRPHRDTMGFLQFWKGYACKR